MPIEPTASDPKFDPKQFDSMVKEHQVPKKKLLPKLPKPALILLGLTLLLFVFLIGYSLLVGNKVNGTDRLVDVMARSREIARVSTLAQETAKSADTRGLALTASATMSSNQKQINKYFIDRKVKIDDKKLLLYFDTATDKQLQAASVNNNYDQVYLDYLKTALASYQTALVSTFKEVGPQARDLLETSNTSVAAILSAPQLK